MFRQLLKFSLLVMCATLLSVSVASAQETSLPTESGAGLWSAAPSNPLAAGQHEYMYEWLCPEGSDCSFGEVFHELADTYPSGKVVSYVSATSNKASCDVDTTTTVSCDFGLFGSGQKIRIFFIVDYADGTQLYQQVASNVSFEVSRRIEVLDPTGIGSDLVTDGGFESKPLADEWKRKHPSKAKQVCNQTGKPPVSFAGECAFRIQGNGQLNGVTQTLEPLGQVGDSIWVGFQVKTKNAKKPVKAQLFLTRASGSFNTYNVTVNGPLGDKNWRLKSGQQYYYGPISKLVLKILYQAPAGTVFIDDVQVKLITPSIFD